MSNVFASNFSPCEGGFHVSLWRNKLYKYRQNPSLVPFLGMLSIKFKWCEQGNKIFSFKKKGEKSVFKVLLEVI